MICVSSEIVLCIHHNCDEESMATDIPVKISIATNSASDFQVVVFTKNYNAGPETVFVAYKVLPASPSTNVIFVYPVTTAVGATCEISGNKLMLGPFPTETGATWEIRQDDEEESPILEAGLYLRTCYSYMIALSGLQELYH